MLTYLQVNSNIAAASQGNSIGANGQTQTKAFSDEAAAKSHADKLIEEKTEKGYVEQ